MRLYFSLLNVS